MTPEQLKKRTKEFAHRCIIKPRLSKGHRVFGMDIPGVLRTTGVLKILSWLLVKGPTEKVGLQVYPISIYQSQIKSLSENLLGTPRLSVGRRVCSCDANTRCPRSARTTGVC